MLEFTDEQVQAAAERLGLTEPGRPVPRRLRSKVAAVLLDERRAAEGSAPAGDVQPAREVVLQPGGRISVDGAAFPWLVADERIEVALHPKPGGISTVRLTLLAEAVRIIEPSESEQNS